MNKILRSSMILMAGAMLLASCQKEEHTVNLTAIVADRPNSNSKVYIDGNYGYWQHGDQVKINGVAPANTYSLSVVSGGTTTATIAGVTKDNDDEYTAGYPASQVSAIDKGVSVTMTIPEVQYYDLQPNISGGSADSQRVAMPMVAYSEDGTSLKFHNVASLVRINLVNKTGEAFDLHYVTVTAGDNNLSGTGTVSVAGLSSEVPAFAISEGGKKSVTLDCCATHPEVKDGENIILYLVVAPFGDNESRDRLNIQVLAQDDANKKYTFDLTSRESGLYIERNQIGTVKVEMTGSGVAADFWGQGNETCPFLITNQTDLEALRTVTNDSTPGYVGNTVFYKQTANITLTSWSTAIGTSDYPFAAHYDGNDCNITAIPKTGLFGYAGGGSIKNLNASTGTLTINSVQNFGTIVNYVSNALKITNCNAMMTLSVGTTAANTLSFNYNGIGGIAGYANAAVTIESCNTLLGSSVNKTETSKTTNITYVRVGGILGYNAASGSSIKKCNNYAILQNTSSTNGSHGSYGGICAYTTGDIEFENDTNHGNMIWASNNTSNTYYTYFAGILAYATGSATISISNCENQGAITNTKGGAAAYRGGILAYSNSTGSTTITNCKNKASINGLQLATTYFNKIGGIVGYVINNSKLEITYCESGKKDEDFTLTGDQVGGICAYANATSNKFHDCKNYMNING